MRNQNEKRFYDALEGIFTGADIEGDSGYVNLLKIKSVYYKRILEQFRADVKSEPLIAGSFEEEFFDSLYSFFEKYFSESGSVYFVKTANWQRVYEQIYTENKDVVLFWKTHMLYYVKSDILFQSMDVTITDADSMAKHDFLFDVSGLEGKQNNEKKEIVFTFTGKAEGKYNFTVSYGKNGAKTKMDDIVKSAKIPEWFVDKAFRAFKKQSEVDFFINKNAHAFLTEQLDMFLHQILLREENKFEQKRLSQLKVIRTFAAKIIDFIAQFEDELVKIWNKPKFALNANYVITIDKLSDAVLRKVTRHKGMPNQIAEWQALGMVDAGFGFAARDAKKHKFLPLDTKHFKSLEPDILNLFEDLDAALDGRMIHSENYQALNTLRKKYKGKVQCIYIDPPFNLGAGADYAYLVNYKDATWATILENRLELARELLSDTGSIFVRCDYNGNYIVRCLLDRIFGKDNFRNEINIKRGTTPKGEVNKIETGCDTLYYYAKDAGLVKFESIKIERENREWIPMHLPGERSAYDQQVRHFDGEAMLPPKGRHWALSQETLDAGFKSKQIKLVKKPYTDLMGNVIPYTPLSLQGPYERKDTNWTDIAGYSTTTGFKTENSEVLLQRVLECASQKGDVVLDFFAGSATTQVVAQKLRRKWIGVEMGGQYNEVDIPRLKHVVNGKSNGISKNLSEKYPGGGLFKCYAVEQYEDTLRNMRYKETPGVIFDSRKTFGQYIFYADTRFAHVLQVGNDKLDIDFNVLYPDIDFAETISNLKGLPIERITKTGVVLKGASGEIRTDYKNMSADEKLAFLQILKPLLWWGE